MEMIENKTYDELAVGDAASLKRTLSEKDIRLFAALTGDMNPVHVDKAYARDSQFHKIIAHGMWGGSLISAVLGTELPGPGTIYLGQDLRFKAPIGAGDTVTTTVRVAEKKDRNRLTLDCTCTGDDGTVLIEGQAHVIAPTTKVRRERARRASVELHGGGARLDAIIDQAAEVAGRLGPLRLGVVHPVDAASLSGALDAAAKGLVEPVLIGPAAKIREAARALDRSLDGCALVDTEHSHAAADRAVAMARAGEVAALMKGKLHTDELLGAVVRRDGGLRTERRISHVFVMDVPSYERPLLVSDAAINIRPDLDALRDIVANTIDVAHALGTARPKVALLSAVETVDAKLDSTLYAAALCKMADRGQITGAELDGPLAFDNAVSEQAAAIKGIRSGVAGHADALIVPDLISGNILAKQLDYLSGAVGAGIVMGARVPIALTSRADEALERVGSAALAVLLHAQALGAGAGPGAATGAATGAGRQGDQQ
ncbi:enoyl-CoA hydratase [Rhodothalassium salexigens]|uniref:bifunctional enoyl-CoA hydratase/phosphate acetyltransferase n=1 Tax=Rhodothalassium salexigens TaxID=1086 RepID=UPI001913CAFD|nr:bifunctional enoyl-CoA hydratase/phosphate acetyltransferase [Rhodothalassium salexigens]MBK5921667.1 enoyl-CoA hydratase [Rhodothalassium salexigens]